MKKHSYYHYDDYNDAKHSLERSVKVIEDLSLRKDAFDLYGSIVLWHIYNICESVLYISCLNDASEKGTISFPTLADLKTFDKIPQMVIPDDVRTAASKISDYSKNQIFRKKWIQIK